MASILGRDKLRTFMDSTSASTPLWIKDFFRSGEYGASIWAIHKTQAPDTAKEREEPSLQGVSSSLKEPCLKIPSRFLQKTQQIHARIFSTCTTRKKRQRKQFPWYCMKTYVSWSETVHDLWYSSKSTSYFRDLNNICHHSGWGHFRQKKKISSFFTFVASLKIALCSSVSHQRSPCFGCTSMGGVIK